jgi:homopolymeric O-antigen transport system ATP-binding protein
MIDTIAPTDTTSAPPPDSDREVAIRVENVGKHYLLYDRPQDRLKQMLFWRFGRTYGRGFWALRNISFTVYKGETVGIIGRNGSGKSTLLQIIAGTLQPTEGEAQVGGRVAALLELGSGFNPEFSGRENVFMNGAILGMSRAEMDQRFDEIAAFADIGAFIDQPVKLYSSGMAVRLAFAVQALLPKEILIVDEALSVGDMFFQAKCMARMKRLIDEGVTVLFVSHDVSSVKSLCNRAVLLDAGQMLDVDSADKVVEEYFALKVQSDQALPASAFAAFVAADLLIGDNALLGDAFRPSPGFVKRAEFQRVQNGKAHFVQVQLLNERGDEIAYADYGQEVVLRMAISIDEDIPAALGCGYHLRDRNGVDIVYSDSAIEQKFIVSPRKGERYVIDWRFKLMLRHNNYTIATVLSSPIDLDKSLVDFCDFVPLAIQFSVAPRQEGRLYGGVHWENLVQMYRYESE